MVPKTPVLMIATALLTVSPAFAQNAATTYPARAIKIIVGFAAGGGTDIVARLVAQKMQESFGQSVFVENRSGGNSMLGPDIAARSAPDGYTLLFAATGQMAVSPAVYPKIPYQPLRDFVPVSMVSSYPLIMVVNGQHPATTMKDFIAWTKAKSRQDQLREHVGSLHADVGAIQAQDRYARAGHSVQERKRFGDERGKQPGHVRDRRTAADRAADRVRECARARGRVAGSAS